MCAASDSGSRVAASQSQREQDGLQYQAGRPSAAPFPRLSHIEDVIARLRRSARRKSQGLRTKFIAAYLGVAYRGYGPHTGQVLRRQARVLAPGPDLLDPNRPASDGGQRQRGAQNLAAPLTVGAIHY